MSMRNVNFDDAAIKFLLDTVKFERSIPRSLQFSKTDIPLDFSHQNVSGGYNELIYLFFVQAFNFTYCKYEDARWVTIDKLMKIKGLGWVRLDETNLTSNDLRNYITHWINSEQDLFRRMFIMTQEEILLDGLFDGLVILEHLHAPSSTIATLVLFHT